MNFEDLYKKLFSIPSNKFLAIFTAKTLLVSLIFNTILIWICIFFSTILAIVFAKTRFNLRRTLFFSNIITFLATMLSFLKVPEAVTFLLVSTMYFCSERKILAQIFSASMIFALQSYKAVMTYLTSLIFLFIFLKIINKNYGKINIKEFVENFILCWLTSDPSFLEKVFERWSEVREGRVRCVCVNDFKIFTSDFHPGPFRNIGGSKILKNISKGKAIYLHSPTSHEMDPVEEFDYSLDCKEKLEPMKPFKIEGENFEIFCIPFNKIRLIFVSGKKFIDDFELKSRNIVVDCHNSYMYNCKVDVEEIERLVRLAENEKIERVNNKKFSFVKIYAESESICNYVAALLFDFDEKFAVVVFDSNNMLKDFRDFIVNEFKKIGYTAIVSTTDNHEKTGIRARVSYKPAGSDKKDYEVLAKLLDECKKAEMMESEFYFGEKIVKAKVLGSSLRDSEIAVKEWRKLTATFLIFNILTLSTSTILEVIA